MNVLIAEDEVLVAESVEGMLEDMGHQVVGRASNGLQAVELAEQVDPDVILMDIKMPRIDGLEAARRISKRCPRPIVVISAYESRELVAQACSAGVSAYLAKPPSQVELERALTIAMARFADLQSLRDQNEVLSKSLDQLRGAGGILPICSGCKKIRDNKGVWRSVEGYFGDHFHIKFSHGICPKCKARLYAEYTGGN